MKTVAGIQQQQNRMKNVTQLKIKPPSLSFSKSNETAEYICIEDKNLKQTLWKNEQIATGMT